jgi:hypothetical protein
VTTPLPDLLAAVPSLNDPNEPFSYTVEGDRIVGTWDIVKATSPYLEQHGWKRRKGFLGGLFGR